MKKRVLKKKAKRLVKYIRKPSNEFGFLTLSLMKKWTLLPANIFLDDGASWSNIGGKRIILLQTNNSEQRDFDKTIPMSIEDNPRVLIENEKVDLTDGEMEQIRGFVKTYRKEIIGLAEAKIGKADFFEGIKG